jgi:hypothetical protein
MPRGGSAHRLCPSCCAVSPGAPCPTTAPLLHQTAAPSPWRVAPEGGCSQACGPATASTYIFTVAGWSSHGGRLVVVQGGRRGERKARLAAPRSARFLEGQEDQMRLQVGSSRTKPMAGAQADRGRADTGPSPAQSSNSRHFVKINQFLPPLTSATSRSRLLLLFPVSVSDFSDHVLSRRAGLASVGPSGARTQGGSRNGVTGTDRGNRGAKCARRRQNGAETIGAVAHTTSEVTGPRRWRNPDTSLSGGGGLEPGNSSADGLGTSKSSSDQRKGESHAEQGRKSRAGEVANGAGVARQGTNSRRGPG